MVPSFPLKLASWATFYQKDCEAQSTYTQELLSVLEMSVTTVSLKNTLCPGSPGKQSLPTAHAGAPRVRFFYSTSQKTDLLRASYRLSETHTTATFFRLPGKRRNAETEL